jgi:hypothetical protein
VLFDSVVTLTGTGVAIDAVAAQQGAACSNDRVVALVTTDPIDACCQGECFPRHRGMVMHWFVS